jgi:hypothetical protein
MSLTTDQGIVQTLGNISFTLLPSTPIFQTDLIYIDFSKTTFDLSQLFNLATFTRGTSGVRNLTNSQSLIRIYNVFSTTFKAQFAFTLASVGQPTSTKPEILSIATYTTNGYIRDYS